MLSYHYYSSLAAPLVCRIIRTRRRWLQKLKAGDGDGAAAVFDVGTTVVFPLLLLLLLMFFLCISISINYCGCCCCVCVRAFPLAVRNVYVYYSYYLVLLSLLFNVSTDVVLVATLLLFFVRLLVLAHVSFEVCCSRDDFNDAVVVLPLQLLLSCRYRCCFYYKMLRLLVATSRNSLDQHLGDSTTSLLFASQIAPNLFATSLSA